MTDISVKTTAYQIEKRDWLWGPTGTRPGENPSIVLDLALFNAAQHFPNGYIPSGIVLGRNASGFYGPYLNSLSNGQEMAVGLLFSSLNVPTGVTRLGGALYKAGFVRRTRLPLTSAATLGGFLDTAAEADLRLIDFSD